MNNHMDEINYNDIIFTKLMKMLTFTKPSCGCVYRGLGRLPTGG